jgi:hypothetical protein
MQTVTVTFGAPIDEAGNPVKVAVSNWRRRNRPDSSGPGHRLRDTRRGLPRCSGIYAGRNVKCAPTATRTRDLPLRRSPVTVEIYLASSYSQLALPAYIASGSYYVTSATVPSYAGECRSVRGLSVGAAAGIPDLWRICGENGVSLRCS